MAKRSRFSMDSLDDNILLHILEKLQDRYDRHAWSLVCKHFMYLEADARKSIKVLRSEVLQKVLLKCSNVKHLDLTCCSRLNDRVLSAVGKFAGNRLISVSMARTVGFTEVGLFAMARQCPHLEDLDLSYCSNLGDSGIIAVAQLRNLKVLKLMGCHSITDAALGCLAAGCKKLKTLNFKGCLGITDVGVSFIVANCKELHTLDLSYTEITDKGLACITQLNTLTTLNLVSCNNVDDAGLAYLQNNSHSLLSLDVSRCQNMSTVGITALANSPMALQQLCLSYFSLVTPGLLSSFHNLASLQSIILDGCEMAADGLYFIGKCCKQVKELSLSKSRGVTDAGIEALVCGCSFLQKVNLTCCRELTDNALLAISNSCKGLLSLKIESCNFITDKGIAYLGKSCPYLEELDLTDCSINDEGLRYLSRCVALRILKLGFCVSITDKGLVHVGANCKNLRELDLYRSTGIGDCGLAAISSGCRRLKAMDLSYCSRITDASLNSMAQLTELQQLDLRGCSNVTSAGIVEMARGCKHLIELDVKRCCHVGDLAVLALVHHCPSLQVINLSHCPVTEVALLNISKLLYIQNLKLVHTLNVSGEGLITMLLACGSLRKIKLSAYLRLYLPTSVVEEVESRGCRIRWMEKCCNNGVCSP